MKTGHAIVLAFLASIFLARCGCNGTGIVGDTDTDDDSSGSDAAGGDTSTDGSAMDAARDPGIESLGEPGWRDSTEPFCRDPGWWAMSWDVWSDSRGVFSIIQEMNPGPTTWPTDDPEETPSLFYLAYNDGMGWRELFEEYGGHEAITCMRNLTGIPGGTLIMHGRDDYTCGGDSRTEAGLTLEYFSATALFVVDETLAYALLPTGLLAFYDGDGWGPYPPEPIPYSAEVLWADRTAIFAAGSSGVIMSEEDSRWVIQDTGTLEDISTLWGFSDSDIWAGTRRGSLLHWDGDVWETVEWPDSADSSDPESCRQRGEPIQGMWGSDGVLFFHTYTQIVMWDGSGFVVLGYWPGEDVWLDDGGHDCENRIGINAIWGNSPNEVFLALHDPNHETSDCAPEVLLWWDGSEFHWF